MVTIESDARYRSLFDNSYDAILLTKPDGSILSANSAACRMFGMSEEEIVRVGRAGLVVSDERLDLSIKEREQKGKVKAEITLKRKDGAIFIGEYTSCVFTDADGSAKTSMIVRDITDRKNAEQALKRAKDELEEKVQERTRELSESEADYKDLTDSVTDLFFAMSSDLSYTYWNKASEEFTGVKAENAIGKTLYEVLGNDDQTTKAAEVYLDVIRTGIPQSFINEFVIDDRKMFFEIQVYPRENGVSVFGKDVTGRREAEEALKESEARYRSMFRDNAASMLLIDPSTGDIVDANQAACKYYGYDHVNLLGMNISSINVLDPDGVKIEMSRSVSGEKRKFDFRHRLASGEARDVDVYSAPICIQGRQLLYSIIHDVTDRKKAELALKESEERFRTLADYVPQLEWMADATGFIFWYNKQWYDYTGTTPEQMKDWGWQSVHDPEALPKVLERWTSTIATGQQFDMVFPLRGADGVFRPFLTRVLPVKDDHGKIVRWFGTNTDITEQMEMQRSLERSNAELQQFAYLASHDLQEPLRMVISYLSLLDRKFKGELDPQAKEYIDHAVDGGARMRQLIDDLLEYSRIETKAKEFASVDMKEVVESTIKILQLSIDESKAEIYVEPMPKIMGDGSRMQQVMQNLISNSLKFHGPERPMVHISAREGIKEWTFSVKDNGIGFNVEYAERIFQMFQRLHNQDQYPGTGVGLAIVKKIVERHGGRIWVESEVGKGATFFFTIPKAMK
jgi:PAS domain S-box-containing protein